MKTEALKLADELAFHQGELSMWTRNESCRMIRRLVEELDEASVVIQDLMTAVTLLKDKVVITERDYNFMQDLALAYEKALETKKLKPLSDEEIPSLLSAQVWRELPIEIKTHLVRAIEERQGIK